MATSSLEVWDDKPNHSACRVRGNRTPPSQDQRPDRKPGPAATRQPGRTADPLRQHRLPLPRRPAAAPRALPDLDPQGRQQDRHPHPGHHPSRRPAPADGELPATTRTHLRTRDPRAPAGQNRPDPARPLTGLSARALTRTLLSVGDRRRSGLCTSNSHVFGERRNGYGRNGLGAPDHVITSSSRARLHATYSRDRSRPSTMGWSAAGTWSTRNFSGTTSASAPKTTTRENSIPLARCIVVTATAEGADCGLGPRTSQEMPAD